MSNLFLFYIFHYVKILQFLTILLNFFQYFLYKVEGVSEFGEDGVFFTGVSVVVATYKIIEKR